MPPPTPLSIARSSLLRLVKEESSYTTELQQQESRLQKLQQSDPSGNENTEYEIRQQQRAIEETKAVFPQLRKRISEAMTKLEEQLEAEQQRGEESNVEEVTTAKEAVAEAKRAFRKLV